MGFFMNDTIPNDANVENVYEIFENVFKFYGKCLRQSIKKLAKSKRSRRPSYYNYLLLDGRKLQPLIEKFRKMDGSVMVFSPEDRKLFIEACFYAGKGKDGRKYKHFLKMEGIVKCKKIKKISDIWDSGHGVAIFQFQPDIDEFEALSREYAIIKALGLEHITNKINGTCYGIMKEEWSCTEIVNFGNMMINACMKNVLQNPPSYVYRDVL